MSIIFIVIFRETHHLKFHDYLDGSQQMTLLPREVRPVQPFLFQKKEKGKRKSETNFDSLWTSEMQ